MNSRDNMKKAVIILIISCVLCWADIIYYNSDYKITNCVVINQKGNTYIVETFTVNGKRSMNISKSIVDAIEKSPVDSSKLSQIIQKNKGVEINITENTKKQRDEYEKQQEALKDENNNRIEERANKDNVNNNKYYYKTNIPLFATGIALSTQGLVGLFNINKYHKLIKEYESSDLVPESLIDEARGKLIEAYIYSSLFTIAGAIDIYYSIEKVEIKLTGTNLNFSYKF